MRDSFWSIATVRLRKRGNQFAIADAGPSPQCDLEKCDAVLVADVEVHRHSAT